MIAQLACFIKDLKYFTKTRTAAAAVVVARGQVPQT